MEITRRLNNCPNCKFILSEEDNFCSNCGQENDSKKASIGVLIKEFAGDYFVYDSKIIRSILPLLFKPGKLTNEFILGKKVKYIKPIRLYLFVSVAYFFVLSLYTQNQNDTSDKPADNKIINSIKFSSDTMSITGSELLVKIDSLGGIDKFVETETDNVFEELMFRQSYKLLKFGGKGFVNDLMQNMSYFMFLLLPLFAFLLKILFKKGKHYYLEHLVLGLHIHSFVFLFQVLYLMFSFLVFDRFSLLVTLFVMTIYTFAALKTVYQYKWIGTVVRGSLVLFLYNLFLLIVLFAVLLISILRY